MYVLVTAEGVDLEDADDCAAFHVVSRGVEADDVADCLSAFGVLEGEHAWIEPEAVRTLAEGQVDDDWDDRFDAMVAYAADKGWVDGEGRLRAHVEWEDAS